MYEEKPVHYVHIDEFRSNTVNSFLQIFLEDRFVDTVYRSIKMAEY